MDHGQEWELKALEGILSDPSAEPIKLSYGLLKLITDDFSNEIGRGGFGVVYQGDLRNGVVAVKKSNGLRVTDKQFMDELKCLKSANHKNIVRFLGYCADTEEAVMPLDGTFVMAGERNRLFCFEYVPNGNVRQYLEKEKSHGDDWPTRYQMIRGVCEGLQYLHEKQINHLDLKPENVMLDAHMEARITDFGLSRLLDQGQSRIITQHICGTLRYIAPEVIDNRELSFKSDMYSLGIIIIEIITSTSMISLSNWDESFYLLDCPRARMCAEIARKCIVPQRDDRPTIDDVIHCMDDLDSMIPKIATMNQLVIPTAFPGTELLDVYPLELRFSYGPSNGELSSRLTVTNKTDCFVYCIVSSKYPNECTGFRGMLPPASSSIALVRMTAQVETQMNMVKWDITLFTTEKRKLMLVPGFTFRDKASKDPTYVKKYNVPEFTLMGHSTSEDLIKGLHEHFGGELHRAALTASVIVDSKNLVVEHTLDEAIKYGRGDFMDVHPKEPCTVYIWNWQTSNRVAEYISPARWLDIREHTDHDSVAKFIAREQLIVLGNKDGAIIVFTCPRMDQLGRFKAHDEGITALAVHPTRPLLLSLSYPFSLKLWDWSQGWSCTKTFDVTGVPLINVRFNHKDTTTFATRGRDGLVQMWTIGRQNPVATTYIRHPSDKKSAFTYTGNRSCVALIDHDNFIRIWDLQNEKQVYTLRSEHDIYVLVVCHPTHPILVTVSLYGRIQVWDSTTYRLKKAYESLNSGINHGVPLYVGFTGSRRLVIGHSKGISVVDIDLE